MPYTCRPNKFLPSGTAVNSHTCPDSWRQRAPSAPRASLPLYNKNNHVNPDFSRQGLLDVPAFESRGAENAYGWPKPTRSLRVSRSLAGGQEGRRVGGVEVMFL